jgi:hypothetical protein
VTVKTWGDDHSRSVRISPVRITGSLVGDYDKWLNMLPHISSEANNAKLQAAKEFIEAERAKR